MLMDERGRDVEVLQQVGCTRAGARCCLNLYGTREERKARAEWSDMLKREGVFGGGEDGDGDGDLKCIIICMSSSKDL
jgi:hypothetical protein